YYPRYVPSRRRRRLLLPAGAEQLRPQLHPARAEENLPLYREHDLLKARQPFACVRHKASPEPAERAGECAAHGLSRGSAATRGSESQGTTEDQANNAFPIRFLTAASFTFIFASCLPPFALFGLTHCQPKMCGIVWDPTRKLLIRNGGRGGGYPG